MVCYAASVSEATYCIIRIAILAFHKALFDHPRDPLVVAVFSLAVYNGGYILEAVNIARKITKSYDNSFYELLEPRDLVFQTLKDPSFFSAVFFVTLHQYITIISFICIRDVRK